MIQNKSVLLLYCFSRSVALLLVWRGRYRERRTVHLNWKVYFFHFATERHCCLYTGGHCAEHVQAKLSSQTQGQFKNKGIVEMLFSSFIYFINKNSTNKGELSNKTQSQALKYRKTVDRGKDTKTVSGRSPRPLSPLAFSYLLFYKCLHP